MNNNTNNNTNNSTIFHFKFCGRKRYSLSVDNIKYQILTTTIIITITITIIIIIIHCYYYLYRLRYSNDMNNSTIFHFHNLIVHFVTNL